MNRRLPALLFVIGCGPEVGEVAEPPDVCVGDDTGRDDAACRSGGTVDDVAVELGVAREPV